MKTKFSYSKKPMPSSTIHDLPPKKEVKVGTPLVTITIRITEKNDKNLKQSAIDTGYSQQDLVNLSLEAFL